VSARRAPLINAYDYQCACWVLVFYMVLTISQKEKEDLGIALRHEALRHEARAAY
jgi:hypothetical protein